MAMKNLNETAAALFVNELFWAPRMKNSSTYSKGSPAKPGNRIPYKMALTLRKKVDSTILCLSFLNTLIFDFSF